MRMYWKNAGLVELLFLVVNDSRTVVGMVQSRGYDYLPIAVYTSLNSVEHRALGAVVTREAAKEAVESEARTGMA